MNSFRNRMNQGGREERGDQGAAESALSLLNMLNGTPAERLAVRASIMGGGVLKVGGLTLTKTGLQSEMSTEADWTTVGEVLAAFNKSLAWLVGDWAALGDVEYGRKYEFLAEMTGLKEGTLRNYAYIAQAFQMSRRYDNLEFKHHAIVAALEPEVADMWLDMAARLSWSTAELAQQVRDARAVRKIERPVTTRQYVRQTLTAASATLRSAVINEDGHVTDPEARAVLEAALRELERLLWVVEDAG